MKAAPFQFLELPRRMPRALEVAVRVQGWRETYGEYAVPEAQGQAARCLDCGNPYCSFQCPLHNAIPQWLALLREGRLFEAAELAHATNPLPEICGRVCPQDRLCEGACTLETGFESVTIGALEKHLVDSAFAAGWRPDLSQVRATGKRVAIVGAGPAGLACADRLARAGVQAVVFDRHEQAGGLLTFGIPAFKLDKAVVARRREVLEAMGVRFELGCEVGRDVAVAALQRDFDALFVATGATTAVHGDLPGRGLPGVLQALPFLVDNTRRLLGLPIATPFPELAGRRVLVLGGGDTAMDCVRSAVRLGAASVHCVYRRGEADMPGSRREVAQARAEGVEFVFRRQPLAIEADAGGLRVRLEGTGPDVGREDAGSADLVLTAFGFRASPAPWFGELGLDLDPRGLVAFAGSLPGQTANPRVFAGGDVSRGADLVVNAVHDGREAGVAIARMLAAA
jgi:glutamate synthase (NADPH/NADH) small chain